MFSKLSFAILLSCLLSLSCFAPKARAASGCVWKITASDGGTLYLGGSIHALRSTDYPLPSAYNRAFDASARLAFEDDPHVSVWTMKKFVKSGEYPKGDSLKNHLDPRTYDYLRRVFGLMNVSEAKFAKLRPWVILEVLWSPNLSGLSSELGVEGFLAQRALANAKPISGLESFREHAEVLSGLTDRQAEMAILLTFIPQQDEKGAQNRGLDEWRRGDVDALERSFRQSFRDYPSFAERLIDARNRAWLPKIERFLHSHDTYFVVVGAAHLGGPNGVLALLRARGFVIQQL